MQPAVLREGPVYPGPAGAGGAGGLELGGASIAALEPLAKPVVCAKLPERDRQQAAWGQGPAQLDEQRRSGANSEGYRIQLGGKLGRHPRLAMELPGIFSEDDVLRVIRDCIAFYKQRSARGERFADLLTAGDLEAYARQWRFPGADHTSPV